MSVYKDPLFAGLTRPATKFGLPVEALLVVITLTCVIFLIAQAMSDNVVWKLTPLGAGVALYGICRLICLRDPRAFRYLYLRSVTTLRHRTRRYWHSGTYSPLAHRIRK